MLRHLGKLPTLLLAGVLAGLALAAAALPVALVGLLGFKTLAAPYDRLPRHLTIPPTAQRSHLYASDGRTLITTFYAENRVDVSLNQVAPVMRQAIVAAEDVRFYRHGGVDLRGVLRAFVANRVGGGVRQGASTLTMQYVRNVLTSDLRRSEEQRDAAGEISAGRKLQEMRYALALERELSKDEILSRYLNIAYFGAGAYGIAAASQRYFGKPPAALTLPEAAMLAGLVRSPDSDEPIGGNAAAAMARRGYVLAEMAQAGMISRAAAETAARQGLGLRPSEEPNDCAAVSTQRPSWGFFCDYFRQWWLAQPAFGRTPQERDSALRRGGYRVVTSLDPRVQDVAQREVLRVYPYDDRRAAPMAVVQPGTGRVLAMAVNRHYSLAPNPPGQATYPNTVNQLVAGGGEIVGYQGGSTFKLFTMLAALEQGLPLHTRFNAPTKLLTSYPISGPGSCGGYWCPANANPAAMNGPRDMWTAFGRSVNTYFVWLAQRIGVEHAVEVARRLGIVFRAPGDATLADEGADQWGPFTLGVSATTPLDLANAYATLAADGIHCAPLPVLSITDAAGGRVAAGEPDCERVLATSVARAATDAARCPVGSRSAYGACDGGTATLVDRILGGRPVVGKTGSSENFASETVVVVTAQLAIAAIAANPDDPRDAVGKRVQAWVVEAVSTTMAEALAGQPWRDFAPPDEATAFGIG